jgi:hypothetical protein
MEITLKFIPSGWKLDGVDIAGGVEVLPHLIALNGPVLVQFSVPPGTFKADSFPLMRCRVESGFETLTLRDGTPCFALISSDSGKAMMAVDHFSVFALLTSQGNEKTDDTDALFAPLHRIQLRNDVPVFYDDDILTDKRMMYYLGGWPQVNGSELWLPELFDFAHPGEVYSGGLREQLYREIFNDLLSMSSFAREYNSVAEPGKTPLDSMVTTIHTLLECKKIDEAIQTSWVSTDLQTDYLKIMSDDVFNGYRFVEYVTGSELMRGSAVSNALKTAMDAGTIKPQVADFIRTNGLKFKSSPSNALDLLLRLSVDRAFFRMKCDAFEELLANFRFTDHSATIAANRALTSTREAFDLLGGPRDPAIGSINKFADALVDYVIANQDDIASAGGITLPQAFGSDPGKLHSENLCSPLTYGAVFGFFVKSGFPDEDAVALAGRMASISAGSEIYGLEQYLDRTYDGTCDGAYEWNPIMFARNLQRIALAGNIAGEFLNDQELGTLSGQPGVATSRGLGDIMQADLGYIYSRLKWDAWAYIVLSTEHASSDWLGPNTPWQVHDLLMEFDPESSFHIRTETNKALNGNIYDDIVEMLDKLIVPVPVIKPKEGIDITIE